MSSGAWSATAQGSQGPNQQIVLGGPGFAVDVREFLGGLCHGCRHGVAAVVGGDAAAVGAFGHGLGHDVQGPARRRAADPPP